MLDLIKTFTPVEIFIACIMTLLAVKEGFSLFDFFYTRIKKYFDGENKNALRFEKLEKDIEAICKRLDSQEENYNNLENNFLSMQDKIDDRFDQQIVVLNQLIDSDKDSIKSWIVKEYHHFTEVQKWIDDFSMESLERRYDHYLKEHGNSYIADMMKDLRDLTRHPPLP